MTFRREMFSFCLSLTSNRNHIRIHRGYQLHRRTHGLRAHAVQLLASISYAIGIVRLFHSAHERNIVALNGLYMCVGFHHNHNNISFFLLQMYSYALLRHAMCTGI